MDRFEKLGRFVSDRMQTPFAWGDDANDCVSYPLAGLEAQGVPVRDVLGLRGWKTELGALRAMTAFVGRSSAPLMDCMDRAAAMAGAYRVPFGFQRRGDVAVWPTDCRFGGQCGLIFPNASGDVTTPGPNGLVFARLDRCALIYRFGEV